MLKTFRWFSSQSLRAIAYATLFAVACQITACSHNPLKQLEEAMDPLLGKKRVEVERAVGQPVQCQALQGSTRCEYRTLVGRNDPAPAAHKPEPGMGPDLSPYEFFDVIEAFYDETNTLKDWHALSVKP